MVEGSPPALAHETQLALTLPETSTFAEWSSLGRRLCAGARVINWLIGDWLIAGCEQYGDQARDEANAIFRSDVDRFGPIVDTCRRFAGEKRHQALTFGHHMAVMAIKDDGEADQLLAEAETQRLTVAAVKAQVRVKTDRQSTMLPDDDPEDTAYRRIVQAWNLSSRDSRQLFLESAQEANMGVIDL